MSEGEDVVASGDNAVQFVGYILQRVSLEYGVCRRYTSCNKGMKVVKSMVFKGRGSKDNDFYPVHIQCFI